MLTIGLTGGIASGKSQVLRRFASAGFRTVDLDRVSREVMAPGGPAYAAVVAAFGDSIVGPGGAIDRKALGRVVFADAEARRRLESIVHPVIRAAERAILTPSGDAVAVVDAALLVETGSHLRFDRLVVVYCEPQEQLCRLIARDGISEAAARARIDAQMPADEKRGFAHFVVDASDGIADTDARADVVIEALRALAGRPAPASRVGAEQGAAMMERGPHEGPRGLTPWRVAEAILAAGMLDLAQLASLLAPPHAGPWYEAPRTGPAGHRAESLAVPVALWCTGRRPADEAFTTAAAASLARLTHRDAPAVAGAIVAALAAARALSGAEGPPPGQGLSRWVAEASAWAGAAPPSPVVDTVRAAFAHPGDREAAARAAEVAGGIPSLARALAGGAPPPALPPHRVQQAAQLLRASAV